MEIFPAQNYDFFVSNSIIKVTTNQWNLNYTTKSTLLKSNLFCQLYHITTLKVALPHPSGLTESCNCKATYGIAILNNIINCLLEVNGKACRHKRAHESPLIPLRYRGTSVQSKKMNYERKTHRIIIWILINKTVILQVILCRLRCIFFWYSLAVECEKDKTKSLLTHGTTPVKENIACLNVR